MHVFTGVLTVCSLLSANAISIPRYMHGAPNKLDPVHLVSVLNLIENVLVVLRLKYPNKYGTNPSKHRILRLLG